MYLIAYPYDDKYILTPRIEIYLYSDNFFGCSGRGRKHGQFFFQIVWIFQQQRKINKQKRYRKAFIASVLKIRFIPVPSIRNDTNKSRGVRQTYKHSLSRDKSKPYCAFAIIELCIDGLEKLKIKKRGAIKRCMDLLKRVIWYLLKACA